MFTLFNKMFYRRNDGVALFGLFMILCALVSYTVACDTNWVGQANSIISILLPAIEGALGLLLTFGAGIPPGLTNQIIQAANEIMADLQNVVKPLLDEYNNAPEADKATVLEKIELALKTIAARFPDILNALHVDNPAIQTKLTTIFSALQSEVLALLALVPVVAGKTTSHELQAAISKFESEGGVLPLNAGQFKHYYKNLFKAKTGDTSVDKLVEHAAVFGKAD